MIHTKVVREGLLQSVTSKETKVLDQRAEVGNRLLEVHSSCKQVEHVWILNAVGRCRMLTLSCVVAM